MWAHLHILIADLNDVEFYALLVASLVLTWVLFDWAVEQIVQGRRRSAHSSVEQSLSTMARKVRAEDRRPLTDRVAADVRQRCDPSVVRLTQFADRAESPAQHPCAKSQLSDESGYQTTRLSVTPRDAA